MPAPRHVVRVQLLINYVWVLLDEPGILADTLTTIRGLTDDGTQRPAEARLRLRDDAHRYDPDNEASDLYGLIGPRTGIQIEVDGRHDFVGEVAAWKPGQSPDWLAGPPQRGYRWTDVVASGPWRRMGQAPKDLPCPQRTRLSQVSLAAWPFDDPAGTQRATPATGNTPALLCPGVAFEAIDGPAGSPRAALLTGTPQWGAPLPFWTGTSMWTAAIVAWQNGATTGGAVRRFWRVVTHIGCTVELWGGTADWTLQVTVGGAVTDTYTVPYVAGSAEDPASATWVRWTVEVSTGPGASSAIVRSYGQHGTLTTWPTRNYAFEVGRPVRFEGPAFDKLGFCGLQFTYDGANLPEDQAAFDGHRGERAADRAARLCMEQYVPLLVQGDPATSEAMGVQGPDTLFNQLKECAATDDGVLVEARTPTADPYLPEQVTGLVFRTRRFLFAQGPRLALTYPQHVARPFGKATDDVTVANVVTAKQRDGGSATARLDSGPYSPDLIGEERRDVAVNVADEAALPDIAAYHLAIGAIPAARFPQLTVDVDVNPGLAEAVQTIEVGDEVTLAGYLPRTVRLSVLGISTTTGSHRRTVTLSLLPAAHRRFGIWDLGQLGPYGDRWNALSALQADVTAAATSMIIESDLFNTWAHAGTPHARLPYDWSVGGERVRVTAITAPTQVGDRYRQTATVIRSVNGVARGHTAGAAVTLYDPIYYVR